MTKKRSSGSQYGRRYWYVHMTAGTSAEGELYVYADELIVTQAGALLFYGAFKPADRENATPTDSHIVIAVAPGNWFSVYEASAIDGDAVAIETEAERRQIDLAGN